MLLADPSPKDVVVGQAPPLAAHLSGPAERGRIEIAEDLERDFTRKDSERVDADQVSELLGEERQLGETAHGEEPMENEGAARMRG